MIRSSPKGFRFGGRREGLWGLGYKQDKVEEDGFDRHELSSHSTGTARTLSLLFQVC